MSLQQHYILPGPDQSLPLHFICVEKQEKSSNKGFQSQVTVVKGNENWAEVRRWAELGYIMSSQNKIGPHNDVSHTIIKRHTTKKHINTKIFSTFNTCTSSKHHVLTIIETHFLACCISYFTSFKYTFFITTFFNATETVSRTSLPSSASLNSSIWWTAVSICNEHSLWCKKKKY